MTTTSPEILNNRWADSMSRLSERLTPKTMFDRLDQLVAERADIRVIFYILRNHSRIPEWLQSIGVSTDPMLRSHVPPLPPRALREIVADPEPEVFLWTGYLDTARILDLYEQYRSAPSSARSSILDFGCGCGRMSRFLTQLRDVCDVHASDINPRHVAWCQEHLREVRTVCNSPLPPLPYADRTFDLVFSLSVFTHLDEPAIGRWLGEFHRILAPGGLLIATTHGPNVLEMIRDSEAHQRTCRMDAAEAGVLLARFAEHPFEFRPYGAARLFEPAEAGSDYGNTFIHPDYIHRKWNDARFQVLQLIPAGLRGWQDIVVMRRLPAGTSPEPAV